MKLVLILIGIFSQFSCRWEGRLKFNPDSTFTILQLTDLHFGENDKLDVLTMELQYQLIEKIQPDLVVMTGDMFSGHSYKCYGVSDCYKHGWSQYTFPLQQLGQKYAIILGNHDAQADLTRKQIIELDMTSPLSLTKASPDGIISGSDYYLPIYDSEEQEIESLLWMFDSHDSGCQGIRQGWGCVEQEQIDWFQKEYKSLLQDNKKQILQSVSFVHIPPQEYVTLFNEQHVEGHARECMYSSNSINLEVSCPCIYTGLVDAMMESDVQANYSGHDHKNDFSGFFHKNDKRIELNYGRKSGFGGYAPPSDMQNGATVITLRSQGNVLQYCIDRVVQSLIHTYMNNLAKRLAKVYTLKEMKKWLHVNVDSP